MNYEILYVSYMKFCAQFSYKEVLNIMYITYEKLGASFPTCNLEFCIIQISKSTLRFYNIKCGIVYISHMKIGRIILLYVKWISLYFTYENLDADFTSWNNESVGRFSYIKYGILYTSYMKVWVVIFLH